MGDGSVESFQPTLKAFTDELHAWLVEHDENFHDGERCEYERANVLAFLVHRMGATYELMVLMVQRLQDYEALHAEHVLDDAQDKLRRMLRGEES